MNEQDVKEVEFQEGRVVEDKRITSIGEADVPSFYLTGPRAGSTSSDASDDPNFSPIRGLGAPADVYPDDQTVRKIQDASTKRYFIDPQYRGIIDAFTNFIIGKGFKVEAVDENPEVQVYLDEFMSVNKFSTRSRQIVMKVLRAGEQFIRFSYTAGEKLARIPVIRTLNYWQITEIDRDVRDAENVTAYIHEYMNEENMGVKETIPSGEIVHIKFTDEEEKRGRPVFEAIVQHCQFYLDWLFNRVVLNRLKTSYYLEEIVKGSPARVSTQDVQATDQNKVSKTGQVIKRMPKPGSKLVHNDAVEYKWLKPDVQADDAKEDGRAIRLAICAGGQIPEFVLGDASQANFSSTVVSQNPFVRKIEFMQAFFEEYFKVIFERVLTRAVANKFIPAKSTETVAVEVAEGVKLWRKMKAKLNAFFDKKTVQERNVGTVIKEQLDTAGNAVTKKVILTKTTVKITWPTLIAQDVLKDTQAAAIHQSMEIVSKRTLAERMGYDYEEEQRRIEVENVDDAEKGGGQDDEMDDEKRQGEIDAMKDEEAKGDVPGATE
jgi:hypothetical protein